MEDRRGVHKKAEMKDKKYMMDPKVNTCHLLKLTGLDFHSFSVDATSKGRVDKPFKSNPVAFCQSCSSEFIFGVL